MWKLYANEGIAVKSSVFKLRDSIKENKKIIVIDKVNYEGNSLGIILNKMPFFSYEQELRAYYHALDGHYEATIDFDISVDGFHINVDLDTLIDEIYIHPNIFKYKNVIENILDKFQLNKNVTTSSLFKS